MGIPKTNELNSISSGFLWTKFIANNFVNFSCKLIYPKRYKRMSTSESHPVWTFINAKHKIQSSYESTGTWKFLTILHAHFIFHKE